MQLMSRTDVPAIIAQSLFSFFDANNQGFDNDLYPYTGILCYTTNTES